MADFLDSTYEVPQKPSNYMKFVSGENKFRFLTSPILGWETWKEEPDGGRKPIRHKMDEPFDVSEVEPEQIKHFWAAVVWNYVEKRVQILEITQKGIQKSLRALARSKDWGSPLGYDILVTKTGEKLETEYQVNPVPPKPLEKEIEEGLGAVSVNLEALYKGDDPFEVNQSVSPDEIPDNL